MMSNFWSGGEENIALEINRSPVVIMTLKGKDKELILAFGKIKMTS